MANDTSTPSGALERDSVSNTDSFFNADAQDSVFDAVQTAQADGAAAPAASAVPQTVTIPEGATVVRVPVTAGEVLELPAPFGGDADLIGRVGDGNLAIKVGDVTVILQGYVDANQQAPVTVETADGQPVDVATMLAATDPALDIQTAAGPGDAAGAQGADNNGAIFAQFGPGGGLGGFSAIGAQDATELNYGLIDNSIRQELADETVVAATPFTFSASGPLGPLNEAFLRHPANSTPWSSYQDFASHYFTEGQANWADFFGTLSEAPDYLDSLHQQADVTASTSPATVLLSGIGNIGDLTSNGSPLHVSMTDGNETAFIYRDSDGALVAVVHVTTDPTDPTTFHIDTYLINRLDDLDANGDPTDATSLDVDFNVYAGEVAVSPEQEGELPAGGLPGTAVFDVADDAPLMDPANPNPDMVGEGEKANSISGAFNFDFGADGPLDALVGGDGNSQVSLLSAITTAVDLSLKVSDPDDGSTVYLQFVNGALTVSNLTSGGSPVDLVQTHDAGHTILTGSIDGGATPVFVITVTDATGAWTFELKAGLDHPDAGETGALDQFQFDLGAQILDDDKDAASGSETFFVNDSGPTVLPPPPPGDDQDPAAYGPGTLVYESALADGSDPAATTETTAGTVTIAAPDGVSAITVAGVTVDLGNVANTATIHGTYGDLTITGWNPATGALDYTYTLLNNDPNHSAATGNDIVQGEDFAVVATDGDGDTATADIAISIVDDIPHAVDDALDTVLVDGSAQIVGNILANDGNGADPDSATKTISNVIGGTVTATGWDIVQADGSGTVHVALDGTVTFTANPGHDFTTPDSISFDYTIVDADGDSSTATASFSAAVRGTPLPETLCLAVDESQLPDGSQGGGGSLTDTQVLTLPDGFTVDAADLGTHTLPNGTLTITQVGSDVTYAYTLDAVVDDGTPNVSDDRNVVDGADTGNTFALHVTGPFGQAGTIGIDVTIQDDVPTAKNDTDIVDDVPNTATGNVMAGTDTVSGAAGADVEGADGATVTKLVGAVTLDTDNSNGLVAIGTYGTLSMSADGTYIYTRTNGDPLSGVTDSFQYTLTDKDGDSSPATLTIGIDDQGVHITNLTSSTDGGDVTVDEDDLGARGPGESLGSDGAQSTTQAGDFTISAPDGVKDLSIDGHAVITNGVFAATSFTTGLGNTLVVTGYDPGSGKISYSYTLLDNEAHADADGQNSRFESFNVQLTDTDNDSDTAILSVKIVDDVPAALNDSKTVSSGGTATGNVEDNDIFGADGPAGGGVVGVIQGSNTGTAVLTGTGVELAGTYGKLTLQTDGSYQYVAYPNTAGVDHFVYTIKDADGDLSTAKLDITVNAVILKTETQTVTVNEAALDKDLDSGDVAAGTVIGSNPGSPDETTTGTLNLDPGISATPGDYPGSYGTLRIDSLGNYTYTLTTNLLVAGAGANVVPGETFLIPIQDGFGNTGTDTIKVNVIDDVPSNFDPEDQSLLNGTAGGIISGALNSTGHTGADGLGSIVFSGGSDGSKAMLADGTTPLTYGGKDVLLSGFGTATLTGFVDGNNDGKYQAGTDTAVFKVTLDGTGDTYTFQLLKDLDDGQRLDFTDLSSVPAGNNAWIGVDSNAANASSDDLLFTARDFGSGDTQQVNRSNLGVSIDDNNGIGAGQGVRLDFVKGLSGSPSTINGFNFSDHYQVQDFQFTMIKVQGNASATTSVKLTAMDVTNPANGGGTTEAAFLAGAIVGLTAGEMKVFHGATDITASVTFTYNPDGTVVVGNLHEGDIIKIHETTGFDRISIDSTGGTDFLIANALVTETVSGKDLDLKFGTTLADGDGDTSAGSYIGINLQTDDGQSHTFNGGSGADTMVGGSGNDYIFGNAGNDTMLYDSKDTYDGGAGFDRLLVTAGGHTVDFDGAKHLGIEMVDLGDTSDRSGVANQNSLVLDASDVVGSNAGTVAGHQISFFVIGDSTGPTADDRDNVHLTGFSKIDSGSFVDPMTGASHDYDVYQSIAAPTVKVAVEQGLDIT